MNKITGIYKITNIDTNDFYIGSSKDIKNRWKQHKYSLRRNEHHNQYLQNAWNKYGENSFVNELVEECLLIKEIILEREQYYIDTLKPQYNISPTAGSSLGVKLSEETKTKISEKLKGRIFTVETLKKNSESHMGVRNPFYGKTQSKETKQKYSEIRKNKTLFKWFHQEYGFEILCIVDLALKYSLISNCLRTVIKGETKHHKGWMLVECLGEYKRKIYKRENNPGNTDMNIYSWFHELHGFVFETRKGLQQLFPELSLARLGAVVRKTVKTHKGWSIKIY